jgi:hypothetical protein
MKTPYLLLLLSLAWVATPRGYAAVPTDLQWLAPIGGDFTPDVPVRLPLPRQVIAATTPGFADLRVCDDQGLEIPYVIYPQSAPPSYTFPFQVLAYSQGEEGDTIVLQRPQDTGPFWELTVHTTARDFHKTVRLQASHDRVTWVEVITDALFDFSSRIDVRKVTLAFAETDAPYLRLHIQDAAPSKAEPAAMQLRYEGLDFAVRGAPAKPFRIDRISGRVGQPSTAAHHRSAAEVRTAAEVHSADEAYDYLTLADLDTRTDTQGNTLVHLGRVNLPLAQLRLTIDNPYYFRRVELWAADTDKDAAYRQVANGAVYKLPGVASAHTTLRVSYPQSPYLRLKILNGDNPPLRLQQIEAAWIRQNLYFIPAAGRRYTLYFGGAPQRPPEYELRRLLPAQPAQLEQYTAVWLGDIQPQPHYTPGLRQWQGGMEKTLLTVIVLVLASGLGLWAYRLLKTVTRAGS